MSGHSKWSTIKRAKGANDAKRGQLFTKLAREIIVSARAGGPDPEMNPSLRLAVQKAKDSNMPNDNIARAITKGAGGDGTEVLEEVTYEGYGPGGVAIIVQALTDKKNRTVSEVRSVFTKGGGNLGEAGCVAWNFETRGLITLETDDEQSEELALVAIEGGADDVKQDGSTLEIYTSPEEFETIRARLERDSDIVSAEVSLLPKTTISLNVSSAQKTIRLLDRLEELDDVQRVFSNGDFPDEVLEQYSAEL